MPSNPKLEDDDSETHPPVNIKSLSVDPQRNESETAMLRKYDKPVIGFTATKSFKEVLEKIQQPQPDSSIIHIYGFSGNGKSQIVRAVCHEMFNVNCGVIWHIKCTPGSDTVKNECIKLLDLLMKACLVDKKLAAQVKKDINGYSQQFVQMLLELNVLVVIAVEDVTLEEQEFVAKLLQDVNDAEKHKTSIPNTGMKVLIATRRKHNIYPADQMNAMDRYCSVQILGFEKSEAEEFLASGLNIRDPTEKDALSKLASILAYSPLRLTLCKMYCRKLQVSYERYLNNLGNFKIIEREKKMLKNYPSLAEHHGYEVIMILLKSYDTDEPEAPLFPVMEMLSFMANEYIPKLLLRKLYHRCYKNLSWQTAEEKMEDMVIALKEDGVLFEHNGLLSTHVDILLAVNLGIPEEEKGRELYEILWALIEIINKDNRDATDNDLLYNLHKHIEIVIKHACNHLDETFNVESPRKTDFRIQMNLSRLYDVLGFARSHNRTKESADECFGKALDMMNAVILSYDGKSLCCKKNSVQSEMLKYSRGKRPEDVVKNLYKQIQKACKKIPVEFVAEYFSPHLPKKYLNDMQEYLKDKNVVECVAWKLMEKELDANGELSSESVKILQGKNVRMLLTPEQLKKCFLLETIVSILHSRGRQILYLQGSVDLLEQNRYEWYSKVGYLLAKKFSEKNGIKIINEYITVANCILPRKLQNRNGELDEVFRERLISARNSAEEVLQPEGLFYERGVFRLVAGTPYTEINGLKYIVKANTKLRKRPGVYIPTEESERQEVEVCERLYRLSKENANFAMSGNCRVQVGKYYAATKKFGKAMEAFESAFSHEGKGINNDLEAKPNTYAWALYNYGRAVSEASPDMENLDEYSKRFTWRYDTLNNQDINEVWKGILKDINNKLHPAQR